MCHKYVTGSLYFGPLFKRSLSFMLRTILRSPVTIWLHGAYRNVESEQLQDLESRHAANHVRRWAKKEDVGVDNLSEWFKSIADVPKRGFRRLNHCQHQTRVHFQLPWCCQRTFPCPGEFCQSPRRHSIQQLYICPQETLRLHLVRETWT